MRHAHAFYLDVNAAGGGYIAGPHPYINQRSKILATAAECRHDIPTYPQIPEPSENLFHANIRFHDAFGYWPIRSFHSSETIAASYLSLYQALGGTRPIE